MTQPTFNECLAWVSEWMKDRHPDLAHTTTKIAQYWGNEFVDYCLYEGSFGEPRFSATNIEVTEYQIFMFVIPATKEELFTVLNILDK